MKTGKAIEDRNRSLGGPLPNRQPRQFTPEDFPPADFFERWRHRQESLPAVEQQASGKRKRDPSPPANEHFLTRMVRQAQERGDTRSLDRWGDQLMLGPRFTAERQLVIDPARIRASPPRKVVIVAAIRAPAIIARRYGHGSANRNLLRTPTSTPTSLTRPMRLSNVLRLKKLEGRNDGHTSVNRERQRPPRNITRVVWRRIICGTVM